jgi:predicted acetyltransferase
MKIIHDQMKPEEWIDGFRLRSSAFGGPVTPDPDRPRIPHDQIRVARADGTVVATAAYAHFGQVLNGHTLPMGGVTGVAVAPHMNGRGLARQMMQDLFELMLDRGIVLATLFASTSRLYRSVGYESAGTWTKRSFPLRELSRVAPDGVSVTEESADAYGELHGLHESHAARSNGWLIRDDWYWARMHQAVAKPERHTRLLVARRAGVPIAAAAVQNTDGSTERASEYDFELLDAFGEPDGLVAIGASLTGHGTIAGLVHTVLDAHDLAALLDRPELCRVEAQELWMARLLDVQAALVARGGGSIGSPLHLDVSDPHLQRNNGRIVVSCDGDEVHVESGGEGTVGITINDLSAMFTGFRSAASLQARGRLGGATPGDVHRLDRLFAAPAPTLTDFF